MKKFRKIMAVLVAALMIAATMVPAWAKDQAVTVTVKFDGNGATAGVPSNKTVEVPAKSTSAFCEDLPDGSSMTPGTVGLVFKGWSKKSDGSTGIVRRLLVSDSETNNEVTLYAIWGNPNDIPSTGNDSSGNNQSLTDADGKIIINNSVLGETYTAYRLFELFSWTDNDVLPDQHDDDKEAYSYYIEFGSPLYTFLKEYYYAETTNPDNSTTKHYAFTFYDGLYGGYGVGPSAVAGDGKGSPLNTENRRVDINGRTMVPVTVNDGFKASASAPISVDENSQDEYQATAAVIQAFAKEALKAINLVLTGTDQTKKDYINATGNKGTVDGNGGKAEISSLKLGYYVVDSTLGSLCALDTTNREAIIVEKNELTQSTKVVQENSSAQWGDKNDADFGETVSFKSTVIIPLGQSKVIYHDIINTTSFDLDWTSITVKAVDESDNDYSLTRGTDYFVYGATEVTNGGTPAKILVNVFPNEAIYTDTTYGKDTFAVAFTSTKTETFTETITVTIEYEATLRPNAKYGEQTFVDTGDGNKVKRLPMSQGNDNQSYVTFGNAQKTEWDWTRTYTWDYQIFKYTEYKAGTADVEPLDTYVKADGTTPDDVAAHKAGYIANIGKTRDDTDYWIQVKPLDGAIFNMKRVKEHIDLDDQGTDDVADDEEVTTNPEELLWFKRIQEGTNSTDPSIYIKVAEGSNGATRDLETPPSGLVEVRGLDASDTSVEANYPKETSKYVLNEKTAPTGYNKLHYDVDLVMTSLTVPATQGTSNSRQNDNIITLTANSESVQDIAVENYTSSEMPSTGGMGTTVLYIVGGMLVILAGAYLFFSRKRTA